MTNTSWWMHTLPFPGSGNSTGASVGQFCSSCGTTSPPCRCKNCSDAHYCNRNCQIKHWPRHKLECRLLKEQEQHAKPLQSTTAPPIPSYSGPPLPTRELYPYRTFLDAWKSFSLDGKSPRGFTNLGNTCYVNALLQALVATPPLAAHLLTSDHHRHGSCPKPTSSSSSSTLSHAWCPLCELSSIATDVLRPASSSSSSISTHLQTFTSHVQCLRRTFTLGDQHDAQELYIALIEAVERIMVLECTKRDAESAKKEAEMNRYCLETTPINYAFTLYLRNQIDCLNCGTSSKSYIADTQITLPVPRQPTTTITRVETLLSEWVAAERLTGDCAYHCDECRKKINADKSTMVEVAPNVLFIHLNRVDMMPNFTMGRGRGQGEESKTTTPVEYCLWLDLSSYMAFEAVDAVAVQYRLYSVIVHVGSTTHDGHYTAFVRYGEQWYYCDDDEIVDKVDAVDVLSAQREACVLLYERQQPRVLTPMDDHQNEENRSEPANAALVVEIEKEEEKVEVAARAVLASGGDDAVTGNGPTQHVQYVCEQSRTADGSKVLTLDVHLRDVINDEETPSSALDTHTQPRIVFKSKKEFTVAQFSCGGREVLRVPLPVKVALPVTESMEWLPSEQRIRAVFHVL